MVCPYSTDRLCSWAGNQLQVMDHPAIIHHSVQLQLQFLFLLGPALAGKLPAASLLSCLAFQGYTHVPWP